ncbi:efflux RND transporter periplasmic adaptor subunit [Roseomonas xinghualingensis]|uniref:efflux RND transporter periplasmic adaptor subunit n=1 Tax=Roseomonas xinghualingensis TaxID=2986475 RepID=UPI0021F243F3|nr:efflux RND transporter periplasmic adaptor subunit [Roseomonas sp. SXEYE001]MCV4207926.1 efflux RND transporter periplasmic adaptor subunit [Roseomonas sp. SXEYE001]
MPITMMRRTKSSLLRTSRSAAWAFLLAMALGAPVPALAQPGPQGPPTVGVQDAIRRPVTESTEFVGRVEAIERVEIIARVTGFLQERLFEEGQEVKKGDPLYRIERSTFEADLARSQAQIASAEAELANARVTLSRAQELSRTGAGTRAALDNATAQDRTANAQLVAARAATRAAEINLGYTEITSPIDGKIGRTNLTIGNVVGPNTGTLAVIVSQDPMRVAFPVSERQVLELRTRYSSRGGVNAVQVRFRTADGRTYPDIGRIDFVDNQISRSTDTLLVRARVANPIRPEIGGRSLIDGQFVTVFVEGVEPVLALTVPRTAVLQDQQGSYVFIVDAESKALRRNIRLGQSTPQFAMVEEGLTPGDKVIVEGIQRVRPGQEVKAVPISPDPATQAGHAQGGAAPAATQPQGNAATGNDPASAAPGGSNPGTAQGGPNGAGGSPPGAPAAPSTGNPGTSQPTSSTPPASQPGSGR